MQNPAPIAFLDDEGDIRVNFGMFAGRDATQAEIDELAHDLLGEVAGDHDRRRAAHDRRPRRWRRRCTRSGSSWATTDPQRPLLIAERGPNACVAERHAEITEA